MSNTYLLGIIASNVKEGDKVQEAPQGVLNILPRVSYYF